MTVAPDRAARDEAARLADGARALAAAALAAARRFEAGATLWCASPGADHHAHHVAVEFVHPVIVGKRSLPALALPADGDLASARALLRKGDLLVVIGNEADRQVSALLRRAGPWGCTSILLATGTKPTRGLADHEVWLGDGVSDLLGYHLLWELTHVVLEHPGLVAEPDGDGCSGDACITCSDDAAIVEVVAPVNERTAVVLADGRQEQVDTSLVPAAAVGDLLLVHAGTAISALEPDP